MGCAGAGTCNFWSAPFFSPMCPCTRIPEHLMQVPDLIDFALPGRGHILPPHEHASLHSRNSFHCPLQSKFDMRYEALSLARILSSGFRCKFSIFGLLFVRPKTFFRAPDFAYFCFLSLSLSLSLSLRSRRNLVTFFGPPKRFFGLEFGLLKRVGGGRFGQARTENKRNQKLLELTGHAACAVLFFSVLPERICWLLGLDCHVISLATTCRLSTQTRHFIGESRWTCRDWATNFSPQEGPIPALRILHLRNFLLIFTS